MKKILLSAALVVASALSSFGALSTTVTVVAGTSTNIFTGGGTINQVIVTANTVSNTAVSFYDTPTYTNFTYTTPAYTNVLSYATNYVYFFTNYWGATTLLTNIAQVDITNNLVAGSTSFYNRVLQAAALSGTSYKLDQARYTIVNGLAVTNPANSGTATITINYNNY